MIGHPAFYMPIIMRKLSIWTCSGASSSYVDYICRGPKLVHFCLYGYLSQIGICTRRSAPRGSFSFAAGHPRFDPHRQYSTKLLNPTAAVTAISMDYGSLQSTAVSPRSTIEATRPTASWKIPRTSETISPRHSWVSLFLGSG